MNRHFLSIILMTALFAAVYSSCDQAVMTEEDAAGQIAVNLTAGIKPVVTYVSNDQWEATDEVGLFMKRTGQALTDFGAIYAGADNVPMSITGQTLTSTPPVLYPTSGNVDFVAYYPYNQTPNYTLLVNVAGQAAGLPEEILYSNNVTNQAPTVSPVQLNFNYSLAKIELTVTGGANSTLDITDFSAVTVSIEELYTQATLQLTDGTFTDFQEKQQVTLYKKSFNATSATFEALVLPTNEAITFQFDMGGLVYRHTLPANYASDTLYRYDFALDFPSFTEGTATLLNAVIIPRGAAAQQNISVDASAQMTMTTESSQVSIALGGTGKVTIDWGDGVSETYTLPTVGGSFSYSYPSVSTHTITITGENVTHLFCDYLQLTSLDVSKNTALTHLQCNNNKLTELDVSKNTALYMLTCSSNQLTELDVSNNTAIEYLLCEHIPLTELDVSKNTALKYFVCSFNQLTSLDVSKNTALNTLYCDGNQLTELDVSKNTELKALICYFNQLTKLDVSKNTALEHLFVNNNQLSAIALDELFKSLHDNTIQNVTKTVYIFNNPGMILCNRLIAVLNGWAVPYEYYEGESGYVQFNLFNELINNRYIGRTESFSDTVLVVKEGGDQFYLERIGASRYLIKYGDKYVVPAIPGVTGHDTKNTFKLILVNATRDGNYLTMENGTVVDLNNPNDYTYTFACNGTYNGNSYYIIFSELISDVSAYIGINSSTFYIDVNHTGELMVVAEDPIYVQSSTACFAIER